MTDNEGPLRFSKSLLDENFLHFSVVESYADYRIIIVRRIEKTGFFGFFKKSDTERLTISYEYNHRPKGTDGKKVPSTTACEAFLHDRNFLNKFNYLGGYAK